MSSGVFLTRVVIRNYKSVAACDVRLGRLTFLVGANGSGKSNFLDALRFVAEAVRFSVDHALRDRGGIQQVRRRSSGHPNHFGIRLEFELSEERRGHFAFEVGAEPRGGYSIKLEECVIVRPSTDGAGLAHYRVRRGNVERSSIPTPPAAVSDRLYLVTLSGQPEFRPLYDALTVMGFYNLSPAEIRDLQQPDPGELLSRSGNNLAGVLATIRTRSPELKSRIEAYLSKVVPGVSGVEPAPVGHKETIEFRQNVKGSKDPWRFLAASMSDGTLRVLGVLVALFQAAGDERSGPRLIGIEEPEVALHPAAAGILRDSIRDATEFAQVLVTSHSPDLLDDESIADSEILAVVAEGGETKIGELDAAGRSALSDNLYTAGELLRLDQLRPDPSAFVVRPEQLILFDAVLPVV
jgi:predicted ATPase